VRYRTIFLAVLLLTLPACASELYLTVQPVQVCDDAGVNCANPTQELFPDFVNTVWAQASITIQFLPWMTLDDSNLYNGIGLTLSSIPFINDGIDHAYYFPSAAFGSAFGASTAGLGLLDAGYALLSDGITDPDVLAHELGHNLGLQHNFSGSEYLMYPITNPDTNIGDIYPNGAGYEKLSSDEISTARQSALLSSTALPTPAPEPSTLLLTSAAACFGVLRHRSAI
jgi:hypothetical protein